jgi:phage gp45-like
MADDDKRFAFMATMKEPSKDKGAFKQARFTADGHEFSAQIVEAFGVQGAPMKGGQAIIIPLDGDMSRCIAIVMPPPKDRVDGQAEGEVTYKNHKAGQTIRHDKDGTTTHEAPGDIIIKTGGLCHINPK